MEVHAVLQGGGRLCLGSGRRTNYHGRTLASLSVGEEPKRIGLSSVRLVIRVYDEASNVIETHESKADFRQW